MTRRFFLSVGALTAPMISVASIAVSTIEFKSDIDARLFDSGKPADFTTTPMLADAPGAAAGYGFLSSKAVHGPLNIKDWPMTKPFFESTVSVGDVESSQNTGLISLLDLDSVMWISASGTKSESQAASSGPDEHFGVSGLHATVTRGFNLKRSPGPGIVPSPELKLSFLASAGAIHMKTHVEGSAEALAGLEVDFVGTVTNNTIPGSKPEDLVSKVLFKKSLSGNEEWSSDALSQDLSLALPDWTRLSGADFRVDYGFHLKMTTCAQAVPEPASLAVAALLGVGTFVRKRRA